MSSIQIKPGVQKIQDSVEAMRSTLVEFADKIWNLAELSLEEEQSSALFIETLKEHGFTIDSVGIHRSKTHRHVRQDHSPL